MDPEILPNDHVEVHDAVTKLLVEHSVICMLTLQLCEAEHNPVFPH